MEEDKGHYFFLFQSCILLIWLLMEIGQLGDLLFKPVLVESYLVEMKSFS